MVETGIICKYLSLDVFFMINDDSLCIAKGFLTTFDDYTSINACYSMTDHRIIPKYRSKKPIFCLKMACFGPILASYQEDQKVGYKSLRSSNFDPDII